MSEQMPVSRRQFPPGSPFVEVVLPNGETVTLAAQIVGSERGLPWADDLADADLGRHVRNAVAIVRAEVAERLAASGRVLDADTTVPLVPTIRVSVSVTSWPALGGVTT
jgi:hypothetical protein